jgi:quercetin dioxygenase-like cupin family protein
MNDKIGGDGSNSPCVDTKKFAEANLHETFVHTLKNMQMVGFVMEQGNPAEIPGLETSDMFLHVKSGEVRLEVGMERYKKRLSPGLAVVIKKGTRCIAHVPMGALTKFYCVFSPPRGRTSLPCATLGTAADCQLFDLGWGVLRMTEYRRVMHTTNRLQLVSMKLEGGTDIPDEIHEPDQFFEVEGGSISVIMPALSHMKVTNGGVVMIPGGTRHRVIAGPEGTRMYTLYSPPQHSPNRVDVVRPHDD